MKTSVKWIAAFSVVTNLLLLVPPLYMLQLYDRVLSTRSVETLFYITLIALAAMALFAAAETVRSRLAQAAAARFAADIGERLFASLSRADRTEGDPAALMRDFDKVRAFLASRIFLSVFDLPFAPVFLVALALLHPLIGLVALAGCCLLAASAWAARRATRAEAAACAERENAAATFGQTTLARAGEMRALGLFDSLRARWSALMVEAVNARSDAVTAASFHEGLGKFVRKALQIVIMGSAAWLVVAGDITGGVIFAASMLTGRALAPVEALITGYDTMQGARAAHARVVAAARDVDVAPPPAPERMAGRLDLEHVRYEAGSRVLLDDVTLEVEPGRALCVSGPSGSGKSLVARIAAGAIEPTSGSVSVDRHPRAQWPDAVWAAGVATMPQDVVLFPGTVAENISRFSAGASTGARDERKLMAAAEVSGALAVVRTLPDGFATRLGPGGTELSSGERALVALARALYSHPRLLILDEPFAHLDGEGERRLLETLDAARRHGCAILVVSNDERLQSFADRTIRLERGRRARSRRKVAAPSIAPDIATLTSTREGETA